LHEQQDNVFSGKYTGFPERRLPVVHTDVTAPRLTRDKVEIDTRTGELQEPREVRFAAVRTGGFGRPFFSP
jgi:hypothetical protein